MAHLLFIDDDPTSIPKPVCQVLPGPAHRVEVAGTGVEGLERVGALPPDIILLDLHLPDQSGLDVYRQLRWIDARIPVIFTPMTNTPDVAIEALEVARRMRQPAVVAETAPDPDVDGAIVGRCSAMCEVYMASAGSVPRTCPS